MFIGIAINLTGRLLSSTSPASLFANGEVGVWYDPSQINTLFQDSAGTTPVTAPNQPVGLMLDKSQGALLGPELVTNGNFSSGTTGWTGVNATISVVSGALRVTATALFPSAYTSITTVVGKKYIVNATLVADAMTGNSFFSVGTTPGAGDVATINFGSTPSTQVVVFTATTTTTYIALAGSSAALPTEYIDWDNISCKLTAGYPAFQPTLAQRPIYGINPIVGTRNLLTYTEQFDNAAWVKGTGGSISANSVVAPDGTTTADAYTFASSTGSFSYLSQATTGISQNANTFSVWLKRPLGSGNRTIRLSVTDVDVSTAQSSTFTVTEAWQRFEFTRTSASTTGKLGVGFFPGSTGTAIAAGEILEVWGAQLEQSATATAYQKVVSQYEVTQAGVQSVSYLAFDGVDDGMVTGTITPGIDKVQVFAGVRKLSDAALAVAVEFSASIVANLGSFTLYAPNSAAANYSFASKGTNASEAIAATYTSPITNVVTCISDISTDVINIRTNGTQVAASFSDQGTGNFLAYPLYLGRRASIAWPYNGRIYSLIVRFGANLTTGKITSTETWVNGKTGAY